jgi:hypothetical protein
MPWHRDEVWFDVDDFWLPPPDADTLADVAPPATELPDDVSNGLAASRSRRAERRRRRAARRTRAAALAIAPAALLPVGGQRIGTAGAGVLQEDPPSLARDVSFMGSGVAEATEPARPPRFASVHWQRATSHGLPYAGWLAAGTQLPLEGPDWVTWNPVEDRVPNEPRRLYGHERTIRAIVSVLAAYRAENPAAPRVVVGDISFRGGGPMELHHSHQNGLDVDVYYPRPDDLLRAPRAGRVDRALAQDLLDRFVAAGAQIVFVGYAVGLRGPSEVVVPYPNHEDHMHVRFPPPRG